MRLVLIEGVAGIGKSRFLLHIARRFSRDAVVLPIHSTTSSAPHCTPGARRRRRHLGLSDEELSTVIGMLPDVPADITRVREIASAMAAGESMADLVSDEEVLWSAGPVDRRALGEGPGRHHRRRHRQREPSVLHVIGQLASLSTPKRVLVVGSIRSPWERTSPHLRG